MSLQKFNFHNVSYYHVPTEESRPYLWATKRCIKKYNREGKISYWYKILKYVLENPNQRNVDIRKAINMGKTGRENRFRELIENRLIVDVSNKRNRSSYVATTDGLLRYLGVMDL